MVIPSQVWFHILGMCPTYLGSLAIVKHNAKVVMNQNIPKALGIGVGGISHLFFLSVANSLHLLIGVKSIASHVDVRSLSHF